MQTYLELEEFCKLVHLNEDVVKGMMANGALNFKEEEGKIYVTGEISHPYLTWLDLNDIQAICQYILKNAKNLQGEL